MSVIANTSHSVQMAAIRFDGRAAYRTVVRIMLFVPAAVIFGWALFGDLSSLTMDSPMLPVFAIVSIVSILSMMTALILMIASRVTHDE